MYALPNELIVQMFLSINGNAQLRRSTGIGLASPVSISGAVNINDNLMKDINGDGRDDLFTSQGVRISDGYGFYPYDGTEPQPLPGEKGDVDGNGLVDVLVSNNLYLLQNNEPDHITSITNGLGHTISITYKSLKDPYTYTSEGTGGFPIRHVLPIDTLWVVTEASHDNGVGGQRSTTYRYGKARTNLHGRGFLGFKWMEEYDTDTDITIRTEFRQEFPFTGMVERVTTSLSGLTLSSTLNSDFVDTTSSNGLIHFPLALASTDIVHELDGTEVKRVTTESVYDSYGNPTSITVQTTGGGRTFTKTTTNLYDNDVTSWHLGRLTDSTVVHLDGTNPSITRTSSFSYDPLTGLLNREIIEPNSNAEAISLITAYQRDDFGNITAKAVCDPIYIPDESCVPALWSRFKRSTFTNYDYSNLYNDGTYIVTRTNAIDERENNVIDTRWGKAISRTDLNNLTTTW